jgi:hypothetical protein
MGASSWWYRCDYREDVGAALQQLQAEVFESGDYYRVWDEFPEHRPAFAGELRMMAEISADEFGPDDFDVALVDGLEGTGPPQSIDQARVWSADSGTHSILDVAKVTDAAELGAVSPLEAAEMERLFGTGRPTVADVEAKRDELDLAPMQRWTGRYVIAHEDGGPAAIFFFGSSGD